MYSDFFSGFITFMTKAANTNLFLELLGALVLTILFWFVRNLILYL